MTMYKDELFIKQRVSLDADQFFNCRFVRCTMIYSGSSGVVMEGCELDSCDWVFDGAADNTLIFLSQLYRGLGSGGQQLVDAIFERIRLGRLGDDALVPASAVESSGANR